jgi:ring-1,2-phenylacetyl-CoA epoxidase subunit PaaC
VTPRQAPHRAARPHRFLLALGDDALVLAQRLGEWAGRAPVLEEDVALANIALDQLGQARALLTLAGRREGRGRDEDALAFLREERQFSNLQLVEQPNGDFAQTVARQLYIAAYQELLYSALAEDPADPELAAIAGKAVKEVVYHRDHAVQWTLRLGDGTAESTARMRSGLDRLWRFTGELFDAVPEPDGEPVFDPSGLAGPWRAAVEKTVTEAGLSLPDGPDRLGWSAGGGRNGIHTEPFGRLLAEMQHLHRSHPGASW